MANLDPAAWPVFSCPRPPGIELFTARKTVRYFWTMTGLFGAG